MLNNFSTDLFVVTVSGRQIQDWGETATPFTDEPIDPKAQLRRGQGGSATRLNRINPGRRVQLFLNPGSPDASYMQGLFETNANISISKVQIGTLEAAVGTEGVIVNDGTVGRGGSTISDNQFTIEFNVWNATK
ncbi:MAG: hypothetical protein ACREA9_03810 [Pyrinomonadaceae bacterium]